MKKNIFSLAVVIGIFCLLGVFSNLKAQVTANPNVSGSGVGANGQLLPGVTTGTTPTSTSAAAGGSYQNQEKIPGSQPTGDFVTYLKQIINFGYAIIGILALFMLVIGAYQYLMAAGSGNAASAKETISSALLGLILGLCSWVILNKINPDLVNMRAITQISGGGGASSGNQNTGAGAGGGNGPGTGNGTGSGKCEPVDSGPCSQAALGNSCFGSSTSQASSICNAESGGGAQQLSKTDITADGRPFSVGLFQINLTVHDIGGLNCPKAFSGKNYSATVVNESLYQQCVQAAQDPNTNIQKACQIGRNGSNWNAWGANKGANGCGF